MADFGRLLRSLREAAGVSMGALARHLEVSVTYLSDVERSTRAPLTSERILKAGELLRLTKTEIHRLDTSAGESRGFYELGITSATAREVGATLMRGWPTYTDSQLERLKQYIEELEATEKR